MSETLANLLDKSLIDKVYPVGSIYMSVNAADPAALFGGTWEQLKDVFLLAAGDTYTAGSTGGEAEHTLAIDEMPSHRHTWKGRRFIDISGNGQSLIPVVGEDPLETSIQPTGGDKPHNNMPPYLAVYMWKRTA